MDARRGVRMGGWARAVRPDGMLPPAIGLHGSPRLEFNMPAPSSAKVVSRVCCTPPPAPTKDNDCQRLARRRATQRDILEMQGGPIAAARRDHSERY